MADAFPFSAIVGQEEMKRALLIAAVDPTIGGVLVFGDRGTGKSTAVRALAALLPPMQVVDGCPYALRPGRPAGLCAAVPEPRRDGAPRGRRCPWWTCRSARPRTAWSARSTWSGR